MKVIYRNFTKLLSIGAFNAEDMIEPMSEFKWNQLLKLSEFNNASVFIFSGIEKISKINTSIIPNAVITYSSNWLEQHGMDDMTKNGVDNLMSDSKIKNFSNIYLNAKFNRIVFNEIHSIDTSIDSLKFLDLSIQNVRKILADDLNLLKIIELGCYLRQNGNRIDFIKVDGWLKKLQLVDMMNLIGCYLICLFDFDEDEIPFFKKRIKNATSNIYTFFDNSMRIIEIEESKSIDEFEKQELKSDRIRVKYFTYFPIEVSSRLFSNIINRISSIEE